MTSSVDMSNCVDIFKKNYLEKGFQDTVVNTNVNFESLDFGFHLEHMKGQIVAPTSDRNMKGDPKELNSEMVQNTKDAAGKKISFTIDQVPMDVLNPLGINQFYNNISEGYEHMDVQSKRTHKTLMDVVTGDMVSYLKFEDNGRGLDGDFKNMFSDDDKIVENYKPGGAYAYFKTDGTRSKEGSSGGSHNTGGKTSVEAASKIYCAFEYSRRSSDDCRIWGGHIRNSVLKKKGSQKATAPRSMFHKNNGDLVNGKEADMLADIFNARRGTGESGFTAIIVEPKNEFKNFDILLLSALEAAQLHIGTYKFSVTIKDNIGKRYVEVNQANYLDIVSYVTSDEYVENLMSNLNKGMIGYVKSIINNLKEYSEDLYKIFAYSQKPTTEYSVIEGFDPRIPELTQDQKVAMQSAFDNMEPIFFKSNVTVKPLDQSEDDICDELVSEMYTILLPTETKKPCAFFDRDGCFLKFPVTSNKKFISFTFFPRVGANKESHIADFLRKCENINHDSWLSNPQVKELYDLVPTTIDKVKKASRELVKAIFKEDGNSVDMSFFDQFFPGLSMDFSNKRQESLVHNIVKDEDAIDATPQRVRGQKSEVSAQKTSIVQNLLKITPKGYNEGFIIEPIDDLHEKTVIPEVNISLAFKELGIINNVKYSSTNLRKHFFIDGLSDGDVDLTDNGNKLVLKNITNNKFKIDISNPDMMRIPELMVVISNNQQ